MIFRSQSDISLVALDFDLWVLEMGILVLQTESLLSNLRKLLLDSEVKQIVPDI